MRDGERSAKDGLGGDVRGRYVAEVVARACRKDDGAGVGDGELARTRFQRVNIGD